MPRKSRLRRDDPDDIPLPVTLEGLEDLVAESRPKTKKAKPDKRTPVRGQRQGGRVATVPPGVPEPPPMPPPPPRQQPHDEDDASDPLEVLSLSDRPDLEQRVFLDPRDSIDILTDIPPELSSALVRFRAFARFIGSRRLRYIVELEMRQAVSAQRQGRAEFERVRAREAAAVISATAGRQPPIE